MKHTLIVLVGVLTVKAVVAAQAGAPQQRRTFEVASVKIHRPNDPLSSMDDSKPDRFTAINSYLDNLLSEAYAMPPGRRASGIPSSLASTRFDIVAKSDGPTTPAEKQEMLRTLLEDRFKLRMRREMVEGNVYALVLARADGRLGPQLRRTSADCARVLDALAADTSPGPPDNPEEIARCLGKGDGNLGRKGSTIGALAVTLSSLSQQVVVDKTGLSGRFDFDLRASIGELAGRIRPASADTAEAPPSIFTALPEQLGLRLEQQRGLIETFVVEHVEMPTPD